jgi:hypothetical protein
LRRRLLSPCVPLVAVFGLLVASATASAGEIVHYTGHIKAFVPTWQGGNGPLITAYGHYRLELSWSESAEIDLSYAGERLSIPPGAWHFETLQGTAHYDQEGLEEAFAKVGVKVVAEKECTATLGLSEGFSEPVAADLSENGEISVTAQLPFATGAIGSSDEEPGSNCSAVKLENHGPQRSFYYIEEANPGGAPVYKEYLAAYLAKITGHFFEREYPAASFNYAYTENRPQYDGGQGEVALTSSLSVGPGTEPPTLRVEFPDGEPPRISPPIENISTGHTKSSPPSTPPPPAGKPSEKPIIEGKPKEEGSAGGIGGVEVKCPPRDLNCEAHAKLTTSLNQAAIAARTKAHRRNATRSVTIGTASISVAGGHTAPLTIKLSRAGLVLLKRAHHLKTTLTISIATPGGARPVTSTYTIVLATPRHR